MTASHDENAVAHVWDQHLGAEFGAKDADAALETMTDNPRVHLIPVMLGGVGREAVREFYGTHFLPQLPPDLEFVPISRTIGQGRLVDEMIARFTHSVRMDWLLPGVAPTGKRIELAAVSVARFEGGKIASENLYWDQASVLLQLGLLDRSLPVSGVEVARQLLDPSVPMNALLQRSGR